MSNNQLHIAIKVWTFPPLSPTCVLQRQTKTKRKNLATSWAYFLSFGQFAGNFCKVWQVLKGRGKVDPSEPQNITRIAKKKTVHSHFLLWSQDKIAVQKNQQKSNIGDFICIMLEQWFTNGILVLADYACNDSYKKANTPSERKDNNNIDSYWLSVPQVISDRDSDIIKNYCSRHSFAQRPRTKKHINSKAQGAKNCKYLNFGFHAIFSLPSKLHTDQQT